MATRTLVIDRPIDEIWPLLQQLETWEGIGGMHDLRDARVDADGDLTRFAFSIETPIGDIRDDAAVTTQRPNGEHATASLRAVADSKGIRITVSLALTETGSGEGHETTAEFSIDGRSTSFLTKPLVGTLRDTLESGIDRESARLVERLASSPS